MWCCNRLLHCRPGSWAGRVTRLCHHRGCLARHFRQPAARPVPESVFAPAQSGLICGYLFDAQGQCTALDLPQAAPWLRGDALPEGAFVWLHFNAANVSAERWLRDNLRQAEHCFEALLEGVRATRLEVVDAVLIAVMNDVVFDFTRRESLQVAPLWMQVERQRVISVRLQPLRAVDRLRLAAKNGERFPTPLSLVDHLLRDQADELIDLLRTGARKVDAIEDRLHGGRVCHGRAQLGELRRDLLRLQRLLAPEPSALFRLLSRPPAALGAQDWEGLRQSTEEFSLVLRDLGTQQERIKLLQEEIAAGINERTGYTLFVLTAVTVVALPINVIAGLFGMNVGGIPFAENKTGFWFMLAIVLLLSSVVAWLLFRARRDE